MGTIIETGKNINIKCKHCNSDVLFHIDEVKVKNYTDNESALLALPQQIYKKYFKEIENKFSFYKDCGYKGNVSKSDTGLSIDEHKITYTGVCPKCGNTIKYTDVIKRDYYIKIYPPKSKEFEYAEIMYIPLDNEEVDKYIR